MIKFCNKCLFPNTKPDLFFNDKGICDACISAESKWNIKKSIDWKLRANEFQKIIEHFKGNTLYDCVVPVSGGKDSTWQTHRLKNYHELKVLAVTFDQFDQTNTGKDNLESLKNIGVDHIHFTINPILLKKLIIKGLKEVGDPYWVNHIGMFTIPHVIASKFEIPLVIYGENPQFEYGGPEINRGIQPMNKRWRQEFGGLRGLREEDMVDNEISKRDMDIFRFPDDETVNGIFYGDYFKWDVVSQTEFISKNTNWKPLDCAPFGSYLKSENCDMKYIDIREHIKYLKYAYVRATDKLNILIRSNSITR